MPEQTKPRRIQLTADRLEEIHFIAGTLVQDFFWLLLATTTADFLQRMEGWLGPLDPTFRGGWVYGRLRRGELKEEDIVPALCEEMEVLFEQYDGMETHHKHDWTVARGREPVSWNGRLYASGYAAIVEVSDNLVSVIDRTREQWSKGDYRTLVTGLRKIVGDADMNNLVVYAEQELAIMRQGAQDRHDLSSYRNISEFVDGNRFKYPNAVKRFLEQHPEIDWYKPTANRFQVHAGQMMAALAQETEQALKTDEALTGKVAAYLQAKQKPPRQREAR
jgi:hypothetical protein